MAKMWAGRLQKELNKEVNEYGKDKCLLWNW